MLLVVCQLRRDIISCEDYKKRVVIFDLSFVSRISVSLQSASYLLLPLAEIKAEANQSSEDNNELHLEIAQFTLKEEQEKTGPSYKR